MAHTAAVSTAIHEAGPVMLPIPPHLQAGLMNLALLKGFVIYMKGVESNVWQPTKRETN